MDDFRILLIFILMVIVGIILALYLHVKLAPVDYDLFSTAV